MIALPAERRPSCHNASATELAGNLLRLARLLNPRQVATSKRGPKVAKPKGYVDGAIARAHVATARVLIQAQASTP